MKLDDFNFYPQLIARDHAAAKAHFVQPGQHEQARRISPNFVERENRARLRQRLDQQHARHHRMLRKMTGEIGFVEGDVLERYDAALFQLDDPIDQQKRIAMRQQPQYAGKLGDLCVVRHRSYFEMVDFLAASDPKSDGWDAPGCCMLAGLTELPGPSPTVPIGTCIAL